MNQYYYLAPDISVVDLKDGNVLFKSDTLAIRLEGGSATFLMEQVLPLLNGDNHLAAVCAALQQVSAEDLQQHLDQLVQAGVLRCSAAPLSAKEGASPSRFFSNFLEVMGRTYEQTLQALSGFRVAVAGLEAHGTQTVLALRQAGITNFRLIDPFPCGADFRNTFSFLPEAASRQESLRQYLHDSCPSVTLGPDHLTKDTLEAAVADCQLLIVCFDKGFTAAYYWCNEISLKHGIPALYSAVRSHICLAGPMVIPGKTACYMCYRMRQLATEEDFDEAMTYEEHLNSLKKPDFSSRAALPGALHFLASVLSGETLKLFFGLSHLSLVDKVLEFDTRSFDRTLHPVLQKPGCPVCQKKKPERRHPNLNELMQPRPAADLAALLPGLVSPHTGIVKKLEIVPKDPSEPVWPKVYMAELANHGFLPKALYKKLTASGKGMDPVSARVSAAGEAVERYSGSIYRPEDIFYASFNSLAGEALHPEELVLYLPEQYDNIDYQPFDPDAEIGWVKACSLVQEKPMYVPAQTAVLNYHPKHPQENICQTTSNGLAAGSTLLDAVIAAAEEVIERDAFIITWHNELPCKRVNPAAHPSAEVTALHEAYRRRGVELRLYELPTDTPLHIFMGVGYQAGGGGPTLVTGLGADFSAEKAARKALLEVGQIRPAFRQRLRMPETQQRLRELLEDPRKVEDLEDHDLLYAVPDKLAAFDFLWRQPVLPYVWNEQEILTAPEKLASLIRYCKAHQHDLLYYNLTPPDMEALGLHTARVIITGFQPIHFGYRNIRLGGNRLYTLPQKLGFRESRVRVAELNTNPHPVA